MKIKILNDAELYLTYSWNEYVNHGICGHTFEVIDYYLLLKKFFKVKILLAELSPEILKTALTKYDLTNEEILEVLDNTEFISKDIKLIKTTKILFTDGGFNCIKNLNIIADRIFIFACGTRSLQENTSNKYTILQDFRVYGETTYNSIHYVKKILFNKLKKINTSIDRPMIYVTENCRYMSEEDIKKFIEDTKINKLLIVANKNEYNIENIEVLNPPVLNIFEQFSTYYYTPIARHFDCSPRFIAECKYYDKEVIYYNIDYLEDDLGLFYRFLDINTNFKSLFLTEEDEIINIIKNS